MITAKKIMDEALSYIGTYDNGNNNVIFNTDYYGKDVSGNEYPWCCAFVWDIFRICGASELFYDGEKTAYCPTVLEWGQQNGLMVDRTEGQYGDIVLFDWNHDGIADHIGFILSRNGNGSYDTVEGNTASYNYSNGGYVLKMTRYYSSIIGIIRPKYDTAMVIDVSEHQGVIDWKKVQKNIDGAIIRCGYGDDLKSQDDKQFIRNLSECERLNIPHGIYLYSYATTIEQAKSELAHILRLVQGHELQLPIFLDCEEKGTEKFASTACKIVCNGLKENGFISGVYASASWWKDYLTDVTDYVRWVAKWGSECTCEYALWQYSESGQIDGINTKVDLNYYGESYNTSTSTDITYQVYTSQSGWLPVVKNLEDFAGKDGEAINGIRVFLNNDLVTLVTRQLSNGNIDRLTIVADKHTIRYRVRTLGSESYLPWMENKEDTGGSSDTYAGESGKAIDRVQMVIKGE